MTVAYLAGMIQYVFLRCASLRIRDPCPPLSKKNGRNNHAIWKEPFHVQTQKAKSNPAGFSSEWHCNLPATSFLTCTHCCTIADNIGPWPGKKKQWLVDMDSKTGDGIHFKKKLYLGGKFEHLMVRDKHGHFLFASASFIMRCSIQR